MANANQLESALDDVFGKKAPKLPDGGKKWIVEVAPWLTLIGGVFSLWSAYWLWHWAHAVSSVLNGLNELCNAFGGGSACTTSATRFSFWVWAGIAVLAVEGVLYLLAFPGLKARTKAGWNYVFYAAFVNLAYAVVSLFTHYNSVGTFIGALIGSAVAFWILFQVRSAYTK